MKKAILAFLMSLVWIAAALAQAPSAPATSQPWLPVSRLAAAVNVTASSAATALPGGGSVVWLCNTGSTDAYVALGASTVSTTATTGSLLKASTCWGYNRSTIAGTIAASMAAITASSTTTITVETGIGTPPYQLSGGGGGGGGNVNLTGINGTAPGTANPLNVVTAPSGLGQQLAAASQSVVLSSDNSNVTALGNVASGSADAGNPIKFGCASNTTFPTVTNGQRVDCQADTRGKIATMIGGQNSSGIAAVTTPTNGGGTQTGIYTNDQALNWNGTAWEFAYSCPNTAVVNVTAGNTTEIVSLTAGQTIRVCAFALSISATGTAGFQYGTGTNCGTGNTAITPQMTLAGTTPPWTMGSGRGTIMRTAAANALCVQAVTGNVTGFITYNKGT